MEADSTPAPDANSVTRSEFVQAYNEIFSLRGGAPVANYGRQAEYVEDLVRRMASLPASDPLDLAAIRALPKDQMLRMVLKAVAGHFISGRSSLRGDVCRLEVDPVSGTLEVTRDGGQNEVVLTVISFLLLIVLFVMLYRKNRASL
jgi:hypothetical protein